jgi:hypothetical protein
MLEQDSFWDAECFAVITDKIKLAMKLTIDEMASRTRQEAREVYYYILAS